MYGLGKLDQPLGQLFEQAGPDTALRAVISPDPETVFRQDEVDVVNGVEVSRDAKLIP